MNIKIQRTRKTPHGCDGRLVIDGTYVCDTTENPTCHLPAGTYGISLVSLPGWMRKMPVLTPGPQTPSSSPLKGATGVFTEATKCGFGPTKGSEFPLATGENIQVLPLREDLGGSAEGLYAAVLGYGNGLCKAADCRIHVGKHRASGLVIHSFSTFRTLYDRINNSLRRGHEITLSICE